MTVNIVSMQEFNDKVKMSIPVHELSSFPRIGDVEGQSFDAKLQFDLTLIPYKTDTLWVENKITEMKATLESSNVPEINKYCEKCLYLDTGKNFI
jgi:hypothetical protein